MLGMLPFGGLSATGQSTGQAVTTTAALLTLTGTVTTVTTKDTVGEPDVRPDATNNRIIVNTPGIYLVQVEISGTAASALSVTLQLIKNAVAAGTGGTSFGGVSKTDFNTTPITMTLTQIVQIQASDLPAAGGIQTFADPSTTPAAYKPAGSFAGAGAAPLTGVPLTVNVTGDGSVTLTLTDTRFTVIRIG